MTGPHEQSKQRPFAPPGANSPVLVDGGDVDGETFRRFYEDVLEPSFPASELIHLGDLSRQHAGEVSGMRCMIALEGVKPIGGMVAHSYSGGVLLLTYLAVRPDWRNRGIGRALIADVVPRWQEELRPSLIVAEVEHPDFHGTSTFGDPEARLRLYERMGARLLPIPYFQPALRPGTPRVRGMLLICFGERRDSVAADIVVDFLDENIAGAEGGDAIQEEPEYRSLRQAAMAFANGIPLWPLSRRDEIVYTYADTR